MSHISRTTFQFQNLDALEAACKSLGLELVRNQKHFKYFSNQQGYCDHAIRIPGNSEAYEIGVIRHGDHFNLAWDTYAGGNGMVQMVNDPNGNTRSNRTGYNHDKLNQAYTLQVSISQLQSEGYRVTQYTNSLGEVIVEAEQ